MKQATKANHAQLENHIKRQRAGMTSEFAHDHPIIDAIAGSLILAVSVGGMIAYWIYVGAGL